VYLTYLMVIEGWRTRYRKIVVWIFDSFWLEYIPRQLRLRCPFDHVFVTETEDLGAWRKILGVPVDWLPWGADVLRLGSAAAERPIDVVRVGRQPPGWEDDSVTRVAVEQRGLSFQGRPLSRPDASDNERELTQTFSRAKFTLSFSNRVSPALQTHPRREYITARWTDALAAGATVAGIPPQSEGVQELLWPAALFDLKTVKLDDALEVLKAAVREWTPARARTNYAGSLERLDWRWRLEKVARAFDRPLPPPLENELTGLRTRLAAARA
jgi:hypothetical protein